MRTNDYNTCIMQLFEEGVNSPLHGDIPIVKLHNGTDCFILDIPKDIERLFRKYFFLHRDEKILLARDTSYWNKRNEGLVITDKRIVYIPHKNVTNTNLYIVRYNSFFHVSNNADSVLFWHTEQNYFAIPKKFFFKQKHASYDYQSAFNQLGQILTKMSIAQPKAEKTKFAYLTNNYAVR